MIGHCIGPYQIEAHIGSGGSAELYRARHLERNTQAAIKIIPRQVKNYSQRRMQLLNEAALTLGLEHRGVVRTLDRGECEDGTFLVQEFLAGQPLHHLLRAETKPGKGLSLSRALGVAAEVAEALAYLHSKGIVHADVKPPNIICDPHRIVICDMGLAVRTGAIRPPGLVMGTPYYMAPEVARGGSLDARADLWSLGIILFEMLSGARPFGLRTNDHLAILKSVQNAPLPRLLEDQPPAVRIMTEFLLEKNKMQRPNDALLVAKKLRGLRETELMSGEGKVESGEWRGESENESEK